MEYKLNCKNMGIDCDWKGKAKTKKELITKAANHGKKVHGYTGAQLKDPKMMEEMMKHIKEHK